MNDKNSLMACMQNRELSWLKFNERVLQQANQAEAPLLERLKFVAIFTNNLAEFFMIRVGTLTDYALYDKDYRDNKTGLSAQEQLDEIIRAVAPTYALVAQAADSIAMGLAGHGLHLLKMDNLNASEIKILKKHFMHNILPLLSPQIIDSRHPFPHLSNMHLHIAVTLEKRKKHVFGIIPMPSEVDRLVSIGEGDGYRFVLLEDLIYYFAEMTFGIYKILEKNIIAVTRNADLDVEEDFVDEDIDYRLHMKNMLKKRQRLSPVRLEAAYNTTPALLDFFKDKLSLREPQIFHAIAPIDFSFCFSLDRIIDRDTYKKLVWPTHTPADAFLSAGGRNMFNFVSGKDLLLSFPFESISPLLHTIRQAAEDNSVISIKITLYRIDVRSNLADSLILAAENGKEVIVLMELRARFDEKNNIDWAHRLEEAGCRVFYGPADYKVHSKVCLITRKYARRIQHITYIGTGNFNEKTARLYTDLSLITANQKIGRDAAMLFSNLLIGNLGGEYSLLWVAPNCYKSNVLQCIEQEREKAKSGNSGRIIIKCNSLTDKEIIENLVQASCDGVDIYLLVRGICCLVPQIEGITENIRVISIVGKFLEHSRLFCFGRGDNIKIYISSADLMTRNTERRVEVACPILDLGLKQRIYEMLETMIMDNTNAWEQFSDGKYIQRQNPGIGLEINSQELFVRQAQLAALRPQITASGGSQ